jgi:hypothetical protein
MDVDEFAIKTLATGIPGATLRHEDFFHFSSDPNGAEDTKRAVTLFDVILLNPPFSCRGNTTISASVGGKLISGSRALAFVARALAYMHKHGELIAILPSSCLTSERDSLLRTTLLEEWDIEPIGGSRSSAFPRCSVTVDVVRVTRRKSSSVPPPVPAVHAPVVRRGRLLLMRGTIAAARSSPVRAGFPFVHSTDLVKGEIARPTRWTMEASRMVSGTALLLPRVGRTKVEKIALKRDAAPVVLSDCVMALKTPGMFEESALREVMYEDWQIFSRLYTGSCAPYLTLRSLAAALTTSGYEVELVNNMAVDQRSAQRCPIRSKRRTQQKEVAHVLSPEPDEARPAADLARQLRKFPASRSRQAAILRIAGDEGL